MAGTGAPWYYMTRGVHANALARGDVRGYGDCDQLQGIVFVTRAPIEWAIVIFSLAFFGQQSWSTLVMIVPTDLFEPRVVASVAGLVGFGGAIGGLLMNLVAGRLLDGGFTHGAVFNIVGSLHVIAFVVIIVTVPRIHAISQGERARE